MAFIFFAGSETGDLSEAGTVVGTVTADTSVVNAGAYSLKLSGTSTQARATATITGTPTEVYARCRIRISVTTNPAPSSTQRNLWLLSDGSTEQGIQHIISSTGVVQLQACNGAPLIGSPTTINQNQWYLLEFHLKKSTTVGVVEWRLDGGTAQTMTGLNTLAGGITNFYGRSVIDSGAVTVYFDDIAISTTLAWIGDGRCVARQGKAGTPTNDAFTKTGAATAALCWSTTPYGTAANCSSSTSGAAQTMLTESFSVTQTGHGTETIASGDTINGCKVAFVGKVAAGSSQSIRQRLNAVNTDTSKTLTTADVYYESGIFTDTLTNINGSEIGCVKGANATLTTIEDAWFMVDYTAATVTPLTAAIDDAVSLADNITGLEPSLASFGENFG